MPTDVELNPRVWDDDTQRFSARIPAGAINGMVRRFDRGGPDRRQYAWTLGDLADVVR